MDYLAQLFVVYVPLCMVGLMGALWIGSRPPKRQDADSRSRYLTGTLEWREECVRGAYRGLASDEVIEMAVDSLRSVYAKRQNKLEEDATAQAATSVETDRKVAIMSGSLTIALGLYYPGYTKLKWFYKNLFLFRLHDIVDAVGGGREGALVGAVLAFGTFLALLFLVKSTARTLWAKQPLMVVLFLIILFTLLFAT